MATINDAHLSGMMAATSSKAERLPPTEYHKGSLRDAWLRGFDEMQQSLGTWSPAISAQQVAPNVTDAKRTVRKRKAKPVADVDAQSPPPPTNRSMMAILEDSAAMAEEMA